MKASFDYFFNDLLEAGIVLKGSEIKSVRSGKVNIGEIAKALGASWKKLKANKKKPFDESAAKDKERYDKAISEYNEKNGL